MVSANVDRVLQKVVALTLDERRELMSLLQTPQVVVPESSAEDLAEAALLKSGIICRIPPRPSALDIARYQSFKPVKVEGKPISESLIEDRR